MKENVKISESFISVFLICQFISMVYTLFLLWYTHINYSIPFPNTELLGDVVLAVNPGADARKWDIVTSKVNNSHYDHGYRRTPYYFLNRSHCWSVSHHYILRFDSEAAEQYRQAPNKPFNNLLGDESSDYGSQLGREINFTIGASLFRHLV